MSNAEKPRETETAGNVKNICLLLASAFAGTGAKVMFDGDYVRGGIGVAVGLFFAIAGLTFSRWKDRVSQQSYRLFLQIADRGLPLVLGLFLLYVMGVLLPRPQPAVGGTNVPTADEIANAVVQKLPKTPAAMPSPPSRPSEPYINPIHTAASKWSIALGIRASIIHGNVPADCKITITRLQVPYSEDLAADLKLVLDTIGWKYDETFASTAVEKELSIRALDGPGPIRDCAEAFKNRLQNDGRTKSGGTYNVGFQWLVTKELPEYLKDCKTPCIEVTIGNEDNR
jgi:hypothetical protein